MGCAQSNSPKHEYDNIYNSPKENIIENSKKTSHHVKKIYSTGDTGPISIKAAILIQNWYRRYRAKLEAKRRYTWMIYQSIEYSGEQDQLKLQSFFNDLLSLTNKGQECDSEVIEALSKTHVLKTAPTVSDEDRDLQYLTKIEQIVVEPTYKGAKLTFPLSINQVTALIESFRKEQILHARYLLELLDHTRNLLKTKPNVSQASTSISKRVTICGDLHGQLDDLVTIFYKNKFPDTSNPYIINGDFVDRGSHSVEIAAILFSFFLLYPQSVFLNRGNHEDHVMNYRYGFVKEIQIKYKSNANKIVRFFADIFSWLPLMTIIDNSILVCHGGISAMLNLDVIEKLDRHKKFTDLVGKQLNSFVIIVNEFYSYEFLSVLQAPVEDIKNENKEEEWMQILDLLWSDPRSKPGCSVNQYRGGGCYFGPDITNDILKKYNLSLLIRSHECKIDGYEWCHENKVVTLFSASNYYKQGSNKGAFLRIDNEHNKQFFQYTTHKKNQKHLTLIQSVNQIEESALRDLKGKILAFKNELAEEFIQKDVNNRGVIELQEWCTVMENVLKLPLPWRTLRPHLVKLSKEGKVEYSSIFEAQQVDNKFLMIAGTMTEELYKNKENLETIFRIMDKDNSGHISLSEFRDACKLLHRHTNRNVSEEAIEDLAKCLDINKDGQIDFNEFLEAFRIVDSSL